MSRFQNTKADALVALAATLVLPIDTTYHLTVATRHLLCPKHVLETNEVRLTSISFEPRDWRFSLIDYAPHDILSITLRKQLLSDEGLSASTMIRW